MKTRFDRYYFLGTAETLSSMSVLLDYSCYNAIAGYNEALTRQPEIKDTLDIICRKFLGVVLENRFWSDLFLYCSELAVFYKNDDFFEYAVFAFRFPFLAKTYSEHSTERLPECCPETSQEGFYKVIGRLVAFSVYETYQQLGLVVGKSFQYRLVFLEEFFFHAF